MGLKQQLRDNLPDIHRVDEVGVGSREGRFQAAAVAKQELLTHNIIAKYLKPTLSLMLVHGMDALIQAVHFAMGVPASHRGFVSSTIMIRAMMQRQHGNG